MTRLLLLASTALLFTACQNATAQKSDIGFAVDRGRTIYAEHCESCHGVNMAGGQAPSMADDNWEYGGTDADIRRIVAEGIDEAGMPAFGDAVQGEPLTDLITYIRKGASDKTTAPVVDVPSVQYRVKVETHYDGLDEPYSMVFLEQDEMVITEKSGRMLRGFHGKLNEVSGLPKVMTRSQSGMFDVVLDPNYWKNFPENAWVYLAYSDPSDEGKAMTKIVRGNLNMSQWENQETLFEAKLEHYVNSGLHHGGRITFDDKGHLFFSIGDRGKQDMAQDLTKPNGKIHRIMRDGSIPKDNPFVDVEGAYPSIYSYGNRNPQGLMIHPDTGVLWETEHGPKGGDELNVIKSGVNYGWPKISYGRNYNGTVLTPHTALPGMAQPVSQWTPSIAVCGLDVYTGDLFPDWKGRLLAGSLANQTLRLIDVDGESYVSEAILIKDQGRVRDVTTGPDGAIYVALPSRIVRITPKP